MTWFDKSARSSVRKAVFAERVPSKKGMPAWLGGPKLEPAPLKTWLSTRPDPCPRPESLIAVADARITGPAPLPRFSIPVTKEPRIGAVESLRPVRSIAGADAEQAAVPEPPTGLTNRPPVSNTAVQEHERRLQAMLGNLEQSIEALATLKSQLEPELERQLVLLAGLIARRVIGRELATDPDLVARLALEGMDALGERDRVIVRVGPLPGGAAEVMAERLRVNAPHCEIIVDPRLDSGHCQVRSEFGQVDESVDARLNVVLGALVRPNPEMPQS
jgi:hypothetical protein